VADADPEAGHHHQPDDAGEHQRPLAFQVREKGGSGGQSDGVAEQHDAEGLDQVHALAEARIEHADQQADEQGAGSPEAQRPELDLPEQRAQSEDTHDGDQGIGRQEFDHRVFLR